MSDQDGRTNLGRGLAALFGEESEDYSSLDKVRAAKTVPIERLHPNPLQPRQNFAETALGALADSIAANGLLQPLLVRRHPERPSEFEIVAGERRWRAAQIAKLHELPVVIRELSDLQALELGLVENMQRQDLTPLEEAEGYHRLIEDFGHTQEDLARAVGKSRSHIANTLRLLGLPEGVRAMLARGELSAGHARAVIGAEEPEALARQIVARGLSVRQAERLVGRAKGGPGGRPAGKAAAGRAEGAGAKDKDPDTLALERDLTAFLGLKVTIEFYGEGGSLTLHYRSLEQLDDILRRLNQTPQHDAD
ncbi:MAG: ParB/RepB/Spo0J family partition protein [Kiloniellaceae bacterium]